MQPSDAIKTRLPGLPGLGLGLPMIERYTSFKVYYDIPKDTVLPYGSSNTVTALANSLKYNIMVENWCAS